jgi:predicted GIY-YIG superfamily endonuclease
MTSSLRPGLHRVQVQLDAVLKDIPAGVLRGIPNGCGAYVIQVESGSRYVGSSNTTRARVQAHRVDNDPSVTEPIRSVCCYLTRKHMDARILEHWLIREIGPELNLSCPAGTATAGARCRHCDALDAPGTVEIVVPVTSTGDVPVAKLALVTRGPGVYVLRTESGKRYVGVSRCVRDRVRAHHKHPAHPNLDGPLHSIGFLETATEADARILEYAMIRDIDPELNRENQADAAEWKIARREALVAAAAPELEALQQALGRGILERIGGREVLRKAWATYQLSPMKNFCAVKILTDCLQVDLKVDDRTFEDPLAMSERLEPTQSWTFNRRVRIRSAADIEETLGLVAQAHRFLKSR